MALGKLLSHSRPVLPQRDCGSRMSVQSLGRMLKFYAIIRAGAVCAVGQIYSNLNICEDVLPFLLYMFSVPHIVTGPCGSPQNVPFERAVWTCSSLLPLPLVVCLTLPRSAFCLSLKTLCLVTPSLSPFCTMDRQLLVLGTLRGDELCPAFIFDGTGVF